MIYASDLDRTLIYSDRFLEIHECSEDIHLIDESTVNSYMAKSVFDGLSDVAKLANVRFVPITTRNLSQYLRLKFNGIEREYAITSNGGVILHNGERMTEWDAIVAQTVNMGELEEIRQKFDELPGVTREATIIDGVFVFTKSDSIEEVKSKLDTLREEYKNYNFTVEKQKIYAIPNVVKKENALNWLRDRLGERFIVASGDSEFDVGIMEVADIAVVPKHNSIKEGSIGRLKNPIFVDGFAVSPLQTFNIVRDNQYK